MKHKSRITKTDIENINITLLAMVGILQSSEIFSVWSGVVDIIKVLIAMLSAMVICLQLADGKVSYRSFFLTVVIALIIVYTCVHTENFSFMLICLFLLTGKSTSIDNFVNRSLKILIWLGGGAYYTMVHKLRATYWPYSLCECIRT